MTSIADSELEFMSELTLSIEGASFGAGNDFCAGNDFDRLQRESEWSSVNDDNECVTRLYGELKKYLELLPYSAASLNAVLDAEHNGTDEKAMSLLQYYQERPTLLEYTLEKELPRMDYTWIEEKTGEFITEKSRIAVLLWEASLSEDPAKVILPRCANQSMLADLLLFLTSESGNSLIRTQFHMAVDTRKVNITIMPSNRTVLVKSTLGLSLPHPSRGLVPIATVDVSVQFSPLAPMFHCHVESVQLVQPCPEDDELMEMAEFLQDLPSFLIEEEEPLGSRPSNRDRFLQQTQTAWKHSSGLARTLLHKMSPTLRNDDEEDQEPREQMPRTPNDALLQKSLRRVREAQRASSQKIMTRLKSASPPIVFLRPTQQQPSQTEPQPKNTWGNVSSRLLNPKQPLNSPKFPNTEKWSGVLRNRLGRMANSLPFPSNQDDIECLVFDQEDSPTEPPSDDEERSISTQALFGSFVTCSAASSSSAYDRSNSSEEDPEDNDWSFREPSEPSFTTRKIPSLTLYEESIPVPATPSSEEFTMPAIPVETSPAPTSPEESVLPDIPVVTPKTIPASAPLKETSIDIEKVREPMLVEKNSFSSSPAITGETIPESTILKRNSFPSNLAIVEEAKPAPMLSVPACPEKATDLEGTSVPVSPDIATKAASVPTPSTKSSSVPVSPEIAPEVSPFLMPSKQSNFTNPFGTKRWQNPSRFLTQLIK